MTKEVIMEVGLDSVINLFSRTERRWAETPARNLLRPSELRARVRCLEVEKARKRWKPERGTKAGVDRLWCLH